MRSRLSFLAIALVLLLWPSATPLARVPVPVFSDDFEYAVGRTDSGATEAFIAEGWGAGTRIENDGPSSANGFIYTLESASVPGGCGTFPTAGSRVLLIEAAPIAQGVTQTDFYLQLGNASSGAFEDYFPQNLWIQFWVCNIDSGAMQSLRHNQNKFLYVCNGSYGCHTHMWMFSETSCNFWPAYSQTSCGATSPTPEFFWMVSSSEGLSTIISNATGVPDDNETKLGHNQTGNPSNTYVPTNAWRLVKINLDTSSAVAGGRARIWMAEPGGAFTLVMDHQNGVNNLIWTFDPARGHRELRMPSTVGDSSDVEESADYFMAMDDFVMAGSEADLPTYDGSGGASGGTGIRGGKGRMRGAQLAAFLGVPPTWRGMTYDRRSRIGATVH